MKVTINFIFKSKQNILCLCLWISPLFIEYFISLSVYESLPSLWHLFSRSVYEYFFFMTYHLECFCEHAMFGLANFKFVNQTLFKSLKAWDTFNNARTAYKQVKILITVGIWIPIYSAWSIKLDSVGSTKNSCSKQVGWD